MMANVLTAEEIKLLEEKAHGYFMGQTLSCGITMLHCLSEFFDIPLDEQVYAAMNGMMENRDKREQCGLYKGSLMFLGVYGAKQGWDKAKINAVTMDFAEKMEADYGSLKCYDLRGGRFLPTEPHDKCAPITMKTVVYTANYIKGLEK